MHEVSTFRLYLLRATYLPIVVGLAVQIWPLILRSSAGVEHMLAVVGLRYPPKMLPLLLFELAWKSIWVVAIGLPLWSADRLDASTRDTWNACLMSLVPLPLVIPWRYVLATYVRAPADRRGANHHGAPRPAV